jgi:hypothetical protein
MRKMFVILAIALGTATTAPATFYHCVNPAQGTCCQFDAGCEGDIYGPIAGSLCKIQCYEFVGTPPGFVVPTGSADCGKVVLCPP